MERKPEEFRRTGDAVTLTTNTGPWSDSDLKILLCIFSYFGYPIDLDGTLQQVIKVRSLRPPGSFNNRV